MSKEYLAVNTRAPRGGGRDVETESGCVQARRAGDINPNPCTHTRVHNLGPLLVTVGRVQVGLTKDTKTLPL